MYDRVWVRTASKDVLTTALERGFTTFVAAAKDAEALRRLGKANVLALDGDGLHDGTRTIPRVVVASKEDQARALALAGKVPAALVAATDWKVIPYENLIAAYQGKGTRLVAEAATP